MKYEIQLVVDGRAYDKRDLSTDEELFGWLGRFGVWYYLALDATDYRDAQWTLWGEEDGRDRILAFTALKETDALDGPHRHGMPTGQLAYGWCWIDGVKKKCQIRVEKKEDAE